MALMKLVKTYGMEVNMTLGAHIRDESKTIVQWKAWTLVGERDDLGGWIEFGVCLVLPACWGGGGAGCRHKTSAPPPELGWASQTASPAPALRPAGRPYSHTAPFTRWEQSRAQDRTGSTPKSRGQSTNTGNKSKTHTYSKDQSPVERQKVKKGPGVVHKSQVRTQRLVRDGIKDLVPVTPT